MQSGLPATIRVVNFGAVADEAMHGARMAMPRSHMKRGPSVKLYRKVFETRSVQEASVNVKTVPLGPVPQHSALKMRYLVRAG
jgi:hypothetical protein